MLNTLLGYGLDGVHNVPTINAIRNPRSIKPIGTSHSPLKLCEVLDVMTYANAYVIKPAGMPKMLGCLSSSFASFSPVGPRDITTLTPGSLVLCLIQDDLPFAIIFCTVPNPMSDSRSGLPDAILTASHAGFFSDIVHNAPTREESSHGLMDFSCGRPVDSLPGDTGSFSELGVGLILGRAMAALKASEMCKVEVHYLDQLTRIAGYNLEILTSGSERRDLDDEGEWTSIEGFSPYIWETLGASRKALPPFKQTDAILDTDNRYASIEPAHSDRQAPIWRSLALNGFLGDVSRRIVTVPNPEIEYHEYGSDVTPYHGVFSEHIASNGSYSLSSAKRILFKKTVYITVPYQKWCRDNPNGDNNFEDATGTAPRLEIEEYDSSDEAAAARRDTNAYSDETYHQQALKLRDKDWGVTKSDEHVGGIDVATQTTEPYTEFTRSLPVSKEVEVDHRTNTRYYVGEASIDVTDDGAVLLKDAYGSCIKMSGGNIEFTCPGDIIMRSGRHNTLISGQDTFIKSHKDVDISSGDGSVRVKAEENLMLLGGNSTKSGGVLIENKNSGGMNFDNPGESARVGGLVLKSEGFIASFSEQMFTKTTSANVIHAERSGITIHGTRFNRYLTSSGLEMVASRGTNTPVENLSYISVTGNNVVASARSIDLLGRSLVILNPAGLVGSGSTSTTIYCEGNAQIKGGWQATNGFGTLKEAPDYSLYEQAITDSKTAKHEAMTQSYEIYLEDEEAILNEDKHINVGFSFRSSEELGTEGNFRLYETDWQRDFRLSGVSTDSFKENPVVNNNVETYPYPGEKVWSSDEGFGTIQEEPHFTTDKEGGRPTEESEASKVEFDLVSLDGAYIVNKKMRGK